MSERTRQSAWVKFWSTGRWWKAVLLAVVYLALYEIVGFSVAPIVTFG